MATAGHGVFRYSIRSLLLTTAAFALVLTPVAWVARERRAMLRAQEAMLHARELALRSVVREGARRRADADASAGANPSLEQLKRENASLKEEVESLRREVRQLKTPSRLTGRANP
jgi:hypothetical protein